MVKIKNGVDIYYTLGDTFKKYAEFDTVSTGDTLRFQIAENENSTLLVDKMFTQSTNEDFEITLTDTEKAKLLVGGNYIYRMSLINIGGEIITCISGNFFVEWGATSETAEKLKLETTSERRLTAQIVAEAEARTAMDEELLTAMNVLDENKSNKDHIHTAEEVGALSADTEIPSKVSQLENDKGYLTEHQDISGKADKAITLEGYGIEDAYTKSEVDTSLDTKADKTTIITVSNDALTGHPNYGTCYGWSSPSNHNKEIRITADDLGLLYVEFWDGEYPENFCTSLCFNSGETPTAISYPMGALINWVGTDCVMDNGVSLFQPSANTHYEILMYFNGTQCVGLVNGFVVSSWQAVDFI